MTIATAVNKSLTSTVSSPALVGIFAENNRNLSETRIRLYETCLRSEELAIYYLESRNTS